MTARLNFVAFIIMTLSLSNSLRKMIYENIKQHNDDLFELDNDIKAIKERIKTLKKKIYRPVEKSKHFAELVKSFEAPNNQKHNHAFQLLIKIRNKELSRLHANTNRLVRIKSFEK